MAAKLTLLRSTTKFVVHSDAEKPDDPNSLVVQAVWTLVSWTNGRAKRQCKQFFYITRGRHFRSGATQFYSCVNVY